MTDNDEDQLFTGSDLRRRTPAYTQVSGVEYLELTHARLPVVEFDGEPWILFAKAMEQIGLNPRSRWRRVESEPWARERWETVTAPADQPRRTRLVDRQTFTGTCFLTPADSVAEVYVDVLRSFQRESADALAAYWTRGIAVNPRGRTEGEVKILEGGGAGFVAGFTHLQQFHYYDQVATGARDDDSLTRSQARERATAAARRAHGGLVRPYLSMAHVDGIAQWTDGADR